MEMSDYGDFEKVGPLGHNLPANDERITTAPGDVILYLGSNITIYYDVNTWSFTRLGKIDGNPTRESILAVLGKGTANVTFELKDQPSAISGVKSEASDLEVHISGRVLSVAKAHDDTPVSIYDSSGKSVYSGFNREISLPNPGLYLVACGSAKTKILIK